MKNYLESAPAFPHAATVGKYGSEPAQPGMSLLEWYAGLAMHALISSQDGQSYLELVQDSFGIANAMVQYRTAIECRNTESVTEESLRG